MVDLEGLSLGQATTGWYLQVAIEYCKNCVWRLLKNGGLRNGRNLSNSELKASNI